MAVLPFFCLSVPSQLKIIQRIEGGNLQWHILPTVIVQNEDYNWSEIWVPGLSGETQTRQICPGRGSTTGVLKFPLPLLPPPLIISGVYR